MPSAECVNRGLAQAVAIFNSQTEGRLVDGCKKGGRLRPNCEEEHLFIFYYVSSTMQSSFLTLSQLIFTTPL